MDSKKIGTAAAIMAVFVEVAMLLLVLAIILGISSITRPLGLSLADKARTAQIDREQAETAKLLAEAGKSQAEGEATIMTAWSKTLETVTSVVMSLFCYVGLPLIVIFAWLYYSQRRR